LRDHNGVGTWHCAVAGEEAAVRAWPAGNTTAPQSQASAALRQSAGVTPTQVSVAKYQLAGTAAPLASRFACLRVRPAHRDEKLTKPRPEEWLLIEWPEGEKEPTKYWLSTLLENIEFAALVDFAKLRWRIERDYQELKQEVGLGH
jgi:SRSO17 transposase